MRLGILFSTVGGSSENMVLKYKKEPNIVCVSYITGCVHINKNIIYLWSLYIQA